MRLAELSHPYEATLAAYAAQVATLPLPEAVDNRVDYLGLVEPAVRHFAANQDADGAVIDDYTARERYYSTPSFALGAAVLAVNGSPDLLPRAQAAMVWAAESLADGRAPDRHPDFFTVFLATADGLIADTAAAESRRRWRAAMRRIEPSAIYQVHDGTDRLLSNWNVINLTGEYLRNVGGLGGSPGWWERHLPLHLARFTDAGMYRDGPLPGTAHPFAYDAVARYFLGAMLDAGYDGAYADDLRTLLLRGALTSLLVQSPTGEWLGAGRSSHHVWNEAALAATYEWAAKQLRDEEPELAAACRRGALLGIRSIAPWQRATGAFHIVRNRCEPEERHGFEIYSNHTTYNLWTVAALAIAHLLADESVVPGAALPSQVGSYAVDLGEDFHQVVAANRGMQIVVDTLSDPATNPTGLVRIARSGCHAQIGPSEGAVETPRYLAMGKTSTLAHAPGWRDRLGTWHSLAAYGDPPRPHLRPVRTVNWSVADDGALTVTITWHLAFGGCRSVTATYRVGTGDVHVRYHVEGTVTGLRAEIPVFASDGTTDCDISADAAEIVARFGGTTEHITLTAGSDHLDLTDEVVASRIGFLRRAIAETAGSTVEYRVAVSPAEDPA